MTCEECVHYEVCNDLVFGGGISNSDAKGCKHFKPKSRFEEVKHGEWVKVGIGIAERIACSQCGSDRGSWQKPPFCCDCGAKMDGEKAIELLKAEQASAMKVYAECLEAENKILREKSMIILPARSGGKTRFFVKRVNAVRAAARRELVERLKKKYSQADILAPRRIVALTERELDDLAKEMEAEENV